MNTNQDTPKFQTSTIAPMHTAEHILNQTMVRMFGCARSKDAHIERKKSKVSYILPSCPSPEKVEEIVRRVNEVISQNLPVYDKMCALSELPDGVDLEKLPELSTDVIRLVYIGDYDICACIGQHVENTSQIGTFHLLGTNWDEETKKFRIRFKLI
jgi:Ser-tRNA(Ala) deacylase AlaX